MYREISKLIIYRHSAEDTILSELGKVFKDFETNLDNREFKNQ